MVFGSFRKSLKTRFDWPETLALSCELLKLGCDWLSRSQTTAKTTDNRIYKEASPKVSSFVLVSTTDRSLAAKGNYKLWFEAILYVGRRTVLSTMLAWFSRKSAHIRTRGEGGTLLKSG